MRLVFTRREDMTLGREPGLFAVLSLLSLGFNELVMWVGTVLLGAHYLVVKVAATAVVMVWNF